jgi:hypothetical protein
MVKIKMLKNSAFNAVLQFNKKQAYNQRNNLLIYKE